MLWYLSELHSFNDWITSIHDVCLSVNPVIATWGLSTFWLLSSVDFCQLNDISRGEYVLRYILPSAAHMVWIPCNCKCSKNRLPMMGLPVPSVMKIGWNELCIYKIRAESLNPFPNIIYLEKSNEVPLNINHAWLIQSTSWGDTYLVGKQTLQIWLV